MLTSAAAKMLWLAKGAALFWGAALTLALVVGVGTVALAAVPGDPLKLGKTNTIDDALTRLVGSNAGEAMLKVDNDSSASGSRALELRVEAGKEPIEVNSDAGKADNLNADEVDGKGAEEIGVNGLEVLRETSDLNSNGLKIVYVECPQGKAALGSLYSIDNEPRGTLPNTQTDVVATTAGVGTILNGVPNALSVTAEEEEPTSEDWSVTGQVVCVTAGPVPR